MPGNAQARKWTAAQPLNSRYILVLCLALMSLLAIFSRPRSGQSHPTAVALDNAPSTLPLSYNRIITASMLFGMTSPTYKRAISTHLRQAQRWGYQTAILEKDEGCGVWTKLIFLLNLVGTEMQKPVNTRAEWIMHVSPAS
jgi:hypothetical protein